jgi:hypothetical protein
MEDVPKKAYSHTTIAELHTCDYVHVYMRVYLKTLFKNLNVSLY